MREDSLRICFASYRGNMHCGGQGVYLWFLARELAALGHRVDVLVGPPYPDPMPFVNELARLPNEQFWGKWFARDRRRILPQPNPLRVFDPLTFYEFAASKLGFLPEPFAFSLRAFHAYVNWTRRGRRYDLVHDVQCLGWGLLGLRALGTPVVTTVHHPLTLDRRASFVRDRDLTEAIGTMAFHPVGMQGFVARRLDGVLTSSEQSARDIARDFRVRPAKIRNVGNGLDTDLYRPDPTVERRPSEILCVGRASDPTKGIALLVEALALLPASVQLVLVDDASSGSLIRRWAEAAGCAERITITGRVPVQELVRLYNRAALVVVPSRHEGFGLPAAEAMACGTPVVATTAGALPEVIATGGGGITVPVGDAAALAKGIQGLLEQEELRASLGARGRRGVVEHYSWPRVARATVSVYRELLAERRGLPTNTNTSARPGRQRATAFSP